MELKYVLAALVAFSAIGVGQGALIPSTLYVEEHRIPNFENTVQNNASTIVTNGEQRVPVIADRTYNVPGSDRQIIFLSGNDYQRFKSSLPAGSGPGFRARMYADDSNGQQPSQPMPRAQAYSSASLAEYTNPARTPPPRFEGEILASGNRLWDSSSAWTTPSSTHVPATTRLPYEYNYRYAARAQLQEGIYQPSELQSASIVRDRDREPYENILRLHRNEPLQPPNAGSEWESEWRAAQPPSGGTQQQRQRPVHPSRLRWLDNDIQTRTDGYGYDSPSGYRRYADSALGGTGAEYRAAPSPAPIQHEREPNYNYYPPSRPTDYSPAPQQPAYAYNPPGQGHGSTGNYNGSGNGSGRRSKCCVVTYTCVLVGGYTNGGQDRDQDAGNQRRRICGPKTTTTPRPNDVSTSDGRRKCCCCCCYVCC